METLDQSKLIQIVINEQRDEGDHLPLIDTGTCGLHTIHGNLRNGIISSGRKIDGVLMWEFTQRKSNQKGYLQKKLHVYDILKIIFKLSNGQSSIERKFTMNKECPAENSKKSH